MKKILNITKRFSIPFMIVSFIMMVLSILSLPINDKLMPLSPFFIKHACIAIGIIIIICSLFTYSTIKAIKEIWPRWVALSLGLLMIIIGILELFGIFRPNHALAILGTISYLNALLVVMFAHDLKPKYISAVILTCLGIITYHFWVTPEINETFLVRSVISAILLFSLIVFIISLIYTINWAKNRKVNNIPVEQSDEIETEDENKEISEEIEEKKE